MLCVFTAHNAVKYTSPAEIIASSLQLPALQTLLFAVLYFAAIGAVFFMSVGSPGFSNISESMPDEELILIYFAQKARDSMIDAARGFTIALIFQVILMICAIAVPSDKMAATFFDSKTSSGFAWVYLSLNVLSETFIYLTLLSSITSRYRENWYIIEDLALPCDLEDLKDMFRDFQDELSVEDRKEWREVLDLSDLVSRRADPLKSQDFDMMSQSAQAYENESVRSIRISTNDFLRVKIMPKVNVARS
jgi:hypothetical protein